MVKLEFGKTKVFHHRTFLHFVQPFHLWRKSFQSGLTTMAFFLQRHRSHYAKNRKWYRQYQFPLSEAAKLTRKCTFCSSRSFSMCCLGFFCQCFFANSRHPITHLVNTSCFFDLDLGRPAPRIDINQHNLLWGE